MRYIKFEGGTAFCGCDFTELCVFDNSITDYELDNIADEYAAENGDSYINIERDYGIYREDFNNDEEYNDAFEQAVEWYWEDCYCNWTELSREERIDEYLEEGGVE